MARSHSPRLHGAAKRAEELLDYGYAKAIVLARFVPVVRTVLSPVAGALGVPVRTFTLWQVVGGLLWSVGLTLVALIVAVSLAPLMAELYRGCRCEEGRV
ncbi:hypothetical protein SALBM311S_03784 [Streptomyces alboniger]